MREYPSREESLKLLKKYNKEPFHIVHALTLEKVLREFAKELGYGGESEFWSRVGLLHDVDFEKYPEIHLQKTEEILKEIDASDDLIRAVLSHGYGMCSDVAPEHEMEKVLFATDELTGLIGAAKLMRPSKSTKDMDLKSVKKKFKDKKFAAGCSRDVIKNGAEMLGWDLDTLLEKTLEKMKMTEDELEKDTKEYID